MDAGAPLKRLKQITVKASEKRFENVVLQSVVSRANSCVVQKTKERTGRGSTTRPRADSCRVPPTNEALLFYKAGH